MELTPEYIAVLSSATAAIVSSLFAGGMQIVNLFIDWKRRKKELYAKNQLEIYNRFINAYANLHGLKDVSEQREFLAALYAAIAISPPKLRSELESLLDMNSTSTIKPTEDNRERFYRCLEMINDHNSKHI